MKREHAVVCAKCKRVVAIVQSEGTSPRGLHVCEPDVDAFAREVARQKKRGGDA